MGSTKPSMSPSVSSLPTFSTELLTFPPSPATPPTESLDTLPSPVLPTPESPVLPMPESPVLPTLDTPESPVLPATTNGFGHQNLGCVSLATTHLFMYGNCSLFRRLIFPVCPT